MRALPTRPIDLARAAVSASKRPGLVEDIPEARRTLPASLRRAPRRSRWLGVGLMALTALIGVSLVTSSDRRFFVPPVPGLAARPGLDGRLLGHIPYAETPANQLVRLSDDQQLHRDAAPALLAMQDAALSDGIDLVVLSAHRSVAMQKTLFFDVKSKRNQSALERAKVSAPPGYSEHSTGYAVDLGDGSVPESHLSERFESTPAFAWLQRHAARFHFQLSFPRTNAQGVSYEPWHWRFEGTADALRTFEAAHRLGR